MRNGAIHAGRHRPPYDSATGLACLLLAVLIPTGSAQEIPLRLPQALILRAAQPENDPNLKAYGQVFDAVALGWRIVSPAVLEAEATPVGVKNGAQDKVGLILVVPAQTARVLTPMQAQWVLDLVERGATLVTEGISALSEKLGFRAASAIKVVQIEEAAFPEVMIVWQRPERVAPLQPPASAAVLTREKWTGAPLVALLPHGRGYCLLLATELDPVQGEGYARYPYFLHALRCAGVTFPFRSERLSAFFDYGYRAGVDLAYFARKWRRAGIQSLHASAWHFFEPDTERDDYLRRLIDACHRNGILVYAWLELPHVSEAFYERHPKWREKTAVRQDAHLDWRYLMNLKDADCFQAVATGLRGLLSRFDWDGVNLAELYFESPDGPKNSLRYTPFNDAVRSEFKAHHRIDPLDFFRENSPHYWRRDASSWTKFVDYRVEQVRLLNEQFLRLLSEIRASAKPHLDLILTFVDNLYDPQMREAVGADIKEILPLLERYDFTLVMEDPSTVWHLGPRRYSDLAQSYARLTRRTGRLGIDINIVDRWEPVYPTEKQTGIEFLQLFRHAGRNFQAVLAYSEQSILNQDLELVAHALAADVSGEVFGSGVLVKAGRPVVYRTGAGPADFRVDGNAWPCAAGDEVLLPAGLHRVAAVSASGGARPRLVRLNGDLLEARYAGEKGIEFSYRARGRAIVLFDRSPESLQVDGAPLTGSSAVFLLPPGGPHQVRATF